MIDHDDPINLAANIIYPPSLDVALEINSWGFFINSDTAIRFGTQTNVSQERIDYPSLIPQLTSSIIPFPVEPNAQINALLVRVVTLP